MLSLPFADSLLRWCIVLFLMGVLGACQFGREGTLRGVVLDVRDGDSVTLRTASGQRLVLRLAAIDAPELDQPFGPEAGELLRGLVAGREVVAEPVAPDRYGRTVAWLRVGEVDVNRWLVDQGGAWVYRRYSNDAVALGLEREARRAGRGLWGLGDDPIAPWAWRQRARPGVIPVDGHPLRQELKTCAAGLNCGALRSCAEARYLLSQCGAVHLDRDGDGVPCEALCRR